MFNCYCGKSLAQLSHLLPILDRYQSILYTDFKPVVDWMKLWRPNITVIFCDKSSIPPCNIVVADYFIFPKTHNSIQIFHGISEKDYINQCREDRYTHIINPSPLYKLKTPLKGFVRSHLSERGTQGTLFCPTHHIQTLPDNLPEDTIIKFHPNDFRDNNPIIKQTKYRSIDIMDREYIEYDLLFKQVGTLISDKSSIWFEFYNKEIYQDDFFESLERCLK